MFVLLVRNNIVCISIKIWLGISPFIVLIYYGIYLGIWRWWWRRCWGNCWSIAHEVVHIDILFVYPLLLHLYHIHSIHDNIHQYYCKAMMPNSFLPLLVSCASWLCNSLDAYCHECCGCDIVTTVMDTQIKYQFQQPHWQYSNNYPNNVFITISIFTNKFNNKSIQWKVIYPAIFVLIYIILFLGAI